MNLVTHSKQYIMQLVQSEFIIFFIVFLGTSFLAWFSFLASYFLDYVLGKPYSQQPNQRAIFFFWTLFLAKRRLQREKPSLYDSLISGIDNDNKFKITGIDGSPFDNGITEESVNLQIIQEGRKYFFWELPFGMCSICTNFWISLFIAICGEIVKCKNIGFEFYDLLFIFVIVFYSHFILRKNI